MASVKRQIKELHHPDCRAFSPANVGVTLKHLFWAYPTCSACNHCDNTKHKEHHLTIHCGISIQVTSVMLHQLIHWFIYRWLHDSTLALQLSKTCGRNTYPSGFTIGSSVLLVIGDGRLIGLHSFWSNDVLDVWRATQGTHRLWNTNQIW